MLPGWSNSCYIALAGLKHSAILWPRFPNDKITGRCYPSCFHFLKLPLYSIWVSVALSSHANIFFKKGRFLRIILIIFAILHSSVIRKRA